MRLWELVADAVGRAATERPLWSMSPTRMARDVLGVRPWRAQRAIMDAVARGDRRVSVYTGHGIGKTLDAAMLVCWAMGCADPPYTVITTAPTFRQVRDQLWREVRRLWTSSERFRQQGECLTTRLECHAGHYAVGFSTREPGRFQGIHAPRILFIVDEANALPESIWEAIDACMVNRQAQVLSLGNPIVPYGHFFQDLERGGVTTMRVSCHDHPNVRTGRELIPGAVTREWVEAFERDYASRPDAISSRVRGLFPVGGARCIVTRDMVRGALAVRATTTWPTALAVDVARYGDNQTAMVRQHGQAILGLVTWEKASVVETADRVEEEWRRDPTDMVVVDDDGVGGGVTDVLASRGCPVLPFHNGGRADATERYANAATEAWWAVREQLEGGVLAIEEEDPELTLQLTTRDYETLPNGRLRLERKEDYTRRTGLPSPDRADALAMACWAVVRGWRGARAA